MFKWLFVTLLLIGVSCFSQKKADTLRLYFNINEIESPANSARIDSAVKALNKNVDVGVFGFADFLSNDEYNIALSQKRADAVKKRLLSKKSSFINVYACEGKGEKFSKDNSSPEGEPKQRRVDIYFEPVVTLNVAESYLETPKEEPKKELEPKSTDKKKIEELDKGESMEVEGLSFVPGRHLILKSAVPVLQKLLKTLENNPNIKIEIQGHVCCTSDADGLDYDTQKRNLSEARAKAIYEYLVAKGINADRLSYKGFGHSRPKEIIEDTPEKEQANRRVEIMVVEK